VSPLSVVSSASLILECPTSQSRLEWATRHGLLLQVSLIIFQMSDIQVAYSSLPAASPSVLLSISDFSSALDSCFLEPGTVTLWRGADPT